MYTIVSGGSGHQNSVSMETLRRSGVHLDVTKLLGQMICRNSPPNEGPNGAERNENREEYTIVQKG